MAEGPRSRPVDATEADGLLAGAAALKEQLGKNTKRPEVIGPGSYGKTLTVLTGMESPDETEDDEGNLEESWAVRFRR